MLFLFSKIACAGLTFTIILLGSIDHAQAFDFSFSFDDKFGNHPGTTSGTIFDLNDDANNQFPTSIVIDNAPASLGLSFPLSFTSFSSFSSARGFDISGGEIQLSSGLFGSSTSGDVNLSLNVFGQNIVDKIGGLGSDTGNNSGFSGVTYNAISVPFDVSTNLPVAIIGTLYGVSRLRKMIKVPKA